MPGAAVQTENLTSTPSAEPLPTRRSVLATQTLLQAFNAAFTRRLPLHRADLSGYGLTTFSAWHVRPEDQGSAVVKVQFEVLNGRTGCEVIQFRARLWECRARVIRSVTIQRHNSGAVVLTDSGWIAVEDGTFFPPGAVGFDAPIENGLVTRFSRIRRIRTTGRQVTLPSKKVMDEVVFDADAVIDTVGRTGEISVPLLNRPGYIHLPVGGVELLNAADLAALYSQVGAISSPIDAAVTLNDTWPVHLTAITSDTAPDDAAKAGFAVASSRQSAVAARWPMVGSPGGCEDEGRVRHRSSRWSTVRPSRCRRHRRPGSRGYPSHERAEEPYGLLMSTRGQPRPLPFAAAHARCTARSPVRCPVARGPLLAGHEEPPACFHQRRRSSR